MKKPTRKQLILMTLGAVVVSIWLLAGKRPLTVEVATLETNVPVKVFGLGTVEARVLSKIGFRLSGSIIELNADEGQFVYKGDTLWSLGPALSTRLQAVTFDQLLYTLCTKSA